ncbi:MAG TPA: hypothetical protein VE819_05260 [Steroidobacteraceae bacterium]|jgi:hypothetical protein|nr:hypothetical protein [Steroidobacteraceae bacterium]
MLLHCGKEDGAAAERAMPAGCWLRAGTLDSLTELNELGLALLAEQSAVPGGVASGLLQPLAELWRALDGAARRRAAACPYLLLDAGFGDPARWRTPPAAAQVGDVATERYLRYFSVPTATEVARLVFIYAWHLSRSQPAAARLLLGMPAASIALISRYTLWQIQALAESHPEWLRPRWPARVQVWRELLLAAASADAMSLERARLRGLTLLAAEARLAAASRAPSSVCRLPPTAAQPSDQGCGPSSKVLTGPRG